VLHLLQQSLYSSASFDNSAGSSTNKASPTCPSSPSPPKPNTQQNQRKKVKKSVSRNLTSSEKVQLLQDRIEICQRLLTFPVNDRSLQPYHELACFHASGRTTEQMPFSLLILSSAESACIFRRCIYCEIRGDVPLSQGPWG
jgi:hypothetical protein